MSSLKIVTIGDFNVHFGKTSTNQYTFHELINSYGELATNFAEEATFITANTTFRKRLCKLCTYMSDSNGAKTQVDFIMIRRKWRNSLKNCETYSSYSSIR